MPLLGKHLIILQVRGAQIEKLKDILIKAPPFNQPQIFSGSLPSHLCSGRKISQILATGQVTRDKKLLSRIWKFVPCMWVAHESVLSAFFKGLGREVIFHNLFFSFHFQQAMGSDPLSHVIPLLGCNLQAKIIVML